MNSAPLLLSSAYFPPVSYFSLIADAGSAVIENEENYLKQSYRNRFRIYSCNGPLDLSVPVLEGSFRKKAIKEIRIDYTKRWQQIHTGALVSSYRSAPYFEYYYDRISEIIMSRYEHLTELNKATLKASLDLLDISPSLEYSTKFEKPACTANDFRYSITPKKWPVEKILNFQVYNQVFSTKYGFIPDLSILDLIFNMGPDSKQILINKKPRPGDRG